MRLYNVLLLLINICGILGANTSNVCYTWQDYYWNMSPIKFIKSPNCTYNNDVVLSLPQIAEKYNNPVETVEVTTLDGYILQMFHIRKPCTNGTIGNTVVLIHGIYQNSLGWFLQGNNSLAFVLANACYDVWVVNLRGTVYSMGHSNTTIMNNPNLFWEFISVHEMGYYDLSAIFSHIYSNNGNQKMVALSFSMGSTALTIYCSSKPKEAAMYLVQTVEMAPVVYLKHLGGILGILTPVWFLVKPLLKNFINLKSFSGQGGNVNIFQIEAFKFIMGLVFGFDPDQFDPATLPIIMARNGELISVNVIQQYIEIKETGVFGALTGSTTFNQEHYNSAVAPIYNLSAISVPNIWIYGRNDPIANPTDVVKAFGELNGSKFLKTPNYKSFNHQDFVSAKDIRILLYNDITMRYLKGNPNN